MKGHQQLLASYGAAAPGTNAKTATFVDNFDDNSRNVALWGLGSFRTGTSNAQVINEVNQRLEISHIPNTAGSNVNGYLSVNAYDLTESSIFCGLILPTTATAHEMRFALFNDANNAIYFRMRGANLGVRWFVNNENLGQNDSAGFHNTVSEVLFLRIRHSSGMLYFDTAKAGVSANPPAPADWNNYFNTALIAGIDYSNLRVALDAGTSASSSGSNPPAKYVGLNSGA